MRADKSKLRRARNGKAPSKQATRSALLFLGMAVSIASVLGYLIFEGQNHRASAKHQLKKSVRM
jgi:hypothetical protein